MLSLGRMGSFINSRMGGIQYELSHGTDAAVSARIMAICKAKKHIRISQQALGFEPAPNGGFDFITCLAIMAAVQAGVHVDIVVSSDKGEFEESVELFALDPLDSSFLGFKFSLFLDLMGYNGHVTSTVAHLAKIYSLLNEHPEKLPPRCELDKWLHLKYLTAHNQIQHGMIGLHLIRHDGPKTEAEMDQFNRFCSFFFLSRFF